MLVMKHLKGTHCLPKSVDAVNCFITNIL